MGATIELLKILTVHCHALGRLKIRGLSGQKWMDALKGHVDVFSVKNLTLESAVHHSLEPLQTKGPLLLSFV